MRLHSFCRSLKREKDQLQQRLAAQQQTSTAPQGLSAESEQQMQGLAEQLSQTETQLQVGGVSDTEGNTYIAAGCCCPSAWAMRGLDLRVVRMV